MKIVRSYSEFLSSLNDDLQRGVIADTNVLVAATYDLDPAHEEASGLFDLMAENLELSGGIHLSYLYYQLLKLSECLGRF